jgi:hypothetical protein
LVSRRTKVHQSIQQGLTNRQWTRSISGGLNNTAVVEYLDLWEATQNFNLTDQLDKTVWCWTPDGEYSAKSAYTMLHSGSIPFSGHTLIWKTWAPLRVKIFLWLAFRKRHWTNDRRARHNLQAQEECYLCDQAPETIDHILTCCPYARVIWFHICAALGQQLSPVERSVITWWRRLRSSWHGNLRKGVNSLFALVSWQIWKERNAMLRNALAYSRKKYNTNMKQMYRIISVYIYIGRRKIWCECES